MDGVKEHQDAVQGNIQIQIMNVCLAQLVIIKINQVKHLVK